MPVLTLWAAVVAERLGHPPATALSLASVVAGTAARAKAQLLGIADNSDRAKDKAPEAARDTVQLLGRKIPLTQDADGIVLADTGGKPALAAPVEAYIVRTFGKRLAEVRAVMEGLAQSTDPEELNRIDFRLYERFALKSRAMFEGGARKASSTWHGLRTQQAGEPGAASNL